jgi:hypothetical protein
MELVLVVQIVLAAAIAGGLVLIFVGPERRAEQERDEGRRL